MRHRFLEELGRRREAEITARLKNRDAERGTRSVLEFVLERR